MSRHPIKPLEKIENGTVIITISLFMEEYHMKCVKNRKIAVLRSGAGYYLGTCDKEGPFCRCSEYYYNQEEAQKALSNRTFVPRTSPENEYCAHGVCFSK